MSTEFQGTEPVDVNAASVEELTIIDGIGPALAQRIVQHREGLGPFATVDELAAVRGIGPSLLERIRAQIVISPEPSQTASAALASPGPSAELAEGAAVFESDLDGEMDLLGQEGGEASQAEEASAAGDEDVEMSAEDSWVSDKEEVAMSEDQVSNEPMMEDGVPAEEIEGEESEGEVPQNLDSEAIEEPVLDVTDDEIVESEQLLDAGISEAEEARQPADFEMTEEEAVASGEEIELVEEEQAAEEAGPAEEPDEAIDREAPAREGSAEEDGGRGFWSAFLLVAGGAVVGALVMLLVLLAYSGTLSYASRNEVDALSRNLDTIYQNSEVAWQRLDNLAAENADLSAKVDRLMLLSGRVSELEQGMSELLAELGELEVALATVEGDLTALRDTYDARLTEMDASLAAQGDLLDRLESDLGEVRETVSGIEERMGRYDGFFGALRDLLIDLQGPPSGDAAAEANGE